uniref:Uncharacterized protein n=1 Tax=Mycena chlorophos TaxID=658473 RepID=A0ABQ0M1X5_MYCCL|nr:predicted protein [Mycena chlorophos]
MESAWAARKDICDFIAIHPLPADANKDEAVAKHRTFIEEVVRTPIGRNRFLKFVQYVQTDAATSAITALRVPAPRKMIISHIVVEDPEHIREVLCDSDIRFLVNKAKITVPGYGQQSTMSTLDTVSQRGNAPITAEDNYQTAFGVFRIPNDVPSQLFEQKIRSFADVAMGLSFVRERTLDYTLWSQNSAVVSEVTNHIALPAPQRFAIIKYEFVGGLDEMMGSAEVQDLVVNELMGGEGPLGPTGDIFVAEKSVILEKI